jgi:hypothetical protein
MTNETNAIAELYSRSRAASYERIEHVTTYSSMFTGSLIRRFLLSVLALCSTVALATSFANAQDSAVTATNAGWWSPATAEATPELMVGIAALNRFEGSGLLATPSPANLDLPTASDDSIANFQDAGSMLNASIAQQALWTKHSSAPAATFLTLIESKYTSWESGLADSRTLTNVNMMSVYPIFQVNYGTSSIPVTLYISPLRGGNTW